VVKPPNGLCGGLSETIGRQERWSLEEYQQQYATARPEGGNSMTDDGFKFASDLSWLMSDTFWCYADPDEVWENQWKHNPEMGKDLRKLLELVVNSLEGLAPAEDEELHKSWREYRELWDWSIDWWYSKDMMSRLREVSRRLEKLSPILTRVTHRKEVNAYLREATQCYLYGFFQGSTTLFRTTLESGIQDLCKRKLGSIQSVDLVDLINQAVRFHLLSEKSGFLATRVRKTATRVIHDKPVSEAQAFDVLVQTRTVLNANS
jgi:hypothetical protein